MMMLSNDESLYLLKHDISSFTQQTFAEISSATSYQHNWHIDLIASKLEACRNGDIKRLIINIPPRYLKSICASVAFPAWLLGHDPSTQIICASYGQDLSNKHARDTRAVMQSAWYQNIFRKTHMDKQKQSIEEFITTQGGMRLSTSVGGTLTGRGGDFIIIDDPLKPDEAVSETQRNKVNDWYDGTLYSRLNDKNNGCIIIIMQRLHEDDLVGHVLEQEEWDIVCLPAIAEEDETHHYESIFGNHKIIRKTGDLLHPEREPQKVIDHMREALGSYNFAGQYQQSPAPLGGGMIKTEWFNHYEPKPENQKYSQIIQSWDTANKATELADYSVCTTWGIKDKKYYLLNINRKKLEFPDLKREVYNCSNYWKPNTILIEDRASGTQLIQDIRRDGIARIVAIEPNGDKLMRMHAQTAVIENGAVYLPEKAPWLADFLHEISCFPNGKHDDQVDSMSQFLNWATQARYDTGPRIRTFDSGRRFPYFSTGLSR